MQQQQRYTSFPSISSEVYGAPCICKRPIIESALASAITGLTRRRIQALAKEEWPYGLSGFRDPNRPKIWLFHREYVEMLANRRGKAVAK